MKKTLLLLNAPLVLAFTSLAISLNQKHEKNIKKTYESFYQHCQENNTKNDPKFCSLCNIAENVHKKLNQIQSESVSTHYLFQDAINQAEIIMKKIEQLPNYQEALEQARKHNTEELWQIVHHIVYTYARTTIQEKSDFTFPSLSKNYSNNHEKLTDFAEANQAIDPDKNGVYLEALSFLMCHIKSIQDECSENS